MGMRCRASRKSSTRRLPGAAAAAMESSVLPDGRPGEVVGRSKPREEGRRPWVEPGAVERFVQPVGLEVDRHERQMGGEPAVHAAHAPFLERLHARLIHLEDPCAFGELRVPQGVAVQPGAEDHVLPDAGRDRLRESILGVARPQDVLGVNRMERSEQLADDDPVEQPVVGDLPPERRHQPHGIGVVQDRIGMPAPVVRPDAGRERRRTADPSRIPGAGSRRSHAQSIQAVRPCGRPPVPAWRLLAGISRTGRSALRRPRRIEPTARHRIEGARQAGRRGGMEAPT